MPAHDHFRFDSKPVADNAVTFTAIAMAESGGAQDASQPSGEDSRGLWQINVEPNDGNIQKSGWISDVTYEGLQGGTDGLAVDPTNPNVGSSGHTGGANFAICDGSVRNAEHLNPSSFQIISAGKGYFDFSQLTTEPTAPEPGAPGGHVKVFMSVDNETYSMLHLASDVNITGDDADDGLLLPAVQDDGLFLPAVRIDDGEATIPDGTSNTVFFSERYGQAGAIGGVSVAGGDLDGATDALGDPVTFTFTVSNPPPATGFLGFPGGVRVASGDVNAVEMGDGYAGSHVLYQDVFVPTLETGPAVAMETLTIAHEGLLI